MARSTQSYKSHRRYIPAFHFFIVPVLVLNAIAQALYWWKHLTLFTAWGVVVAIALVVLAFAARTMALTAQDRVIRLEERMRLQSVLPADSRGRIHDLTPGQLVGLRFASDEELPELTRRCLAGDLRSAGQVKKEVKNWRPDHLRV